MQIDLIKVPPSITAGWNRCRDMYVILSLIMQYNPKFRNDYVMPCFVFNEIGNICLAGYIWTNEIKEFAESEEWFSYINTKGNLVNLNDVSEPLPITERLKLVEK